MRTVGGAFGGLVGVAVGVGVGAGVGAGDGVGEAVGAAGGTAPRHPPSSEMLNAAIAAGRSLDMAAPTMLPRASAVKRGTGETPPTQRQLSRLPSSFVLDGAG
jgi:hypothetical protein